MFAKLAVASLTLFILVSQIAAAPAPYRVYERDLDVYERDADMYERDMSDYDDFLFARSGKRRYCQGESIYEFVPGHGSSVVERCHHSMTCVTEGDWARCAGRQAHAA